MKTTINHEIIFSKINYYLLLFLACSPMLTLISSLIFGYTIFYVFFEIETILFGLTYIFYFIVNAKSIKIKKPKDKLLFAMLILMIISFVCLVVSSFVTHIAINNLLAFLYVLLFFSVLMLKKDQAKVFLFLLIANFAFSCLLGIIDPTNYVFPGFSADSVPSSLFFFHSNYSQAISVLLIILTYNILLKEKNKILIICYALFFVLIGIHMFLNGSSAGISAVLLAIIVQFIVLWVKNKKFPIKLFFVLLAFVAFSFLIELYPNIQNLRSSQYNYFVEMIATFDNIFGTNLTQALFNIDFVPGSDGWNRTDLMKNSLWAACGGNETNFGEKLLCILFGLGGGSIHEIGTHNLFVGTWVDFGILFAISNYSIYVCGIIFLIKNLKINYYGILPYIFSIFAYLFATLFLSLIVYHYIYFVIVFALAINKVKNEKQELLEKKQNLYKLIKEHKNWVLFFA